MADDPTAADARDPRFAQMLAVEPLDEVTRRRLVQEALARSTPRAARFVNVAAVAAAIVIGAGLGWLLVQEPEVRQTQATAPTEAAAPAPDAAEGGESELRTSVAAAPIRPLGELGDVTRTDDLRAAVDDAFAATEYTAGAPPAAASGYPCADVPPTDLGLVAVVAVGAGTYEGEAVTVAVGTSPTGDPLAVVVGRTPRCRVLRSVVLPEG